MSEPRAFFGTIAMSTVNAGKLALQLAVLPVMARLLGPSAFGLIAIAMPFILLSNLLSDAGMGAALVRQLKPSRELESTVFWLSVAISVTLSLIICGLCMPLAAMFGEPTLAPVLAALSAILVISGGLSVPNAAIWRRRDFGMFAVGDFISALASAAAGILAALHGWGVWSLVSQQLVLWVTKALWIIPASRFRPSFYCKPSLARPFLAFGMHGVGAGLADMAGKSLPAAVVGGLLGVTAAGHYSMGYQLTRIPEMVLSGPVYLSMFAAIAHSGEDRRAAADLSLKGLRLLLLVCAPLFCGLALIADVATTLLLGAKWAQAAPVIALLCPGAFLLCAYTFCGAVLMGAGRSDRKLRLTLLIACCVLAGCTLGARFGVSGVAAGFSLAVLIALPFYVRSLGAELRLGLRQIGAAVTGPLLATLGMAAILVALRQYIHALPDWIRLATLVAAGVAAYGALLAMICGRQVMLDLKQLLPLEASPRGGLS